MKNLALFATAAIIIFGGGVYLYYYFFRQINAKLIETIPTDAAFLFQINDNETFLKTVKTIHPFINSLFELNAYPGCQFFVDQLPGKYNQVVFSGHANGETFAILFACKINERAFDQLLSKLQIDIKNCIKFDQCKIYTHGTHLKRFVFTYHKGIFVASENMILLQKAITQLKNPKNLTTLKSFSSLYNVTEKNKKQNWLIINHEKYFSCFEPFFNHETNSGFAQFSSNVPWAAYQFRISGLEMLLAGYVSVNSDFTNYLNQIETKHLYLSSLSKKDVPVDVEKDHQLKYAKMSLPSNNDFEIVLYAGNTEFWESYLSETGLKKFTVAKMKLFAFSLQVETGNGSSVQLANGFIKF
jgi:hypothetical protein